MALGATADTNSAHLEARFGVSSNWHPPSRSAQNRKSLASVWLTMEYEAWPTKYWQTSQFQLKVVDYLHNLSFVNHPASAIISQRVPVQISTSTPSLLAMESTTKGQYSSVAA